MGFMIIHFTLVCMSYLLPLDPYHVLPDVCLNCSYNGFHNHTFHISISYKSPLYVVLIDDLLNCSCNRFYNYSVHS
ncbi:unnamed protein product [Callosobruchus maculatus]|uniref:Secreted protein n=1 Tax=Callosobruchus maculatus TaxID=64391 RepID=A0A653DUJ4_CALMS|nr:unnamed protein product [Callosobruchus maculatus]